MFYYLTLNKALDIHPKDFGSRLREVLQSKPITEGRTRQGIFEWPRIREDQSGYATFEVTYGCIVCRPYKGEVLDAVATSVDKVSWKVVSGVMGFFVQARPLQLFVTQHFCIVTVKED
ncbi:DNA-directed RNA polymerase II subunit RPB7 [Tetrabaena socialis]|uniref:DNA-directed RNA polymerase II subunit RPB7 n=1 Tax=Tetrabaena socialis TaxID=47790 RepID=A0A2J7ZN71_9CHLO|nr:DNA-directed RNA polymerase II subunit RPB7 [Tetrabaena socialis]|eukprot:PNH01700.1 DNA-directed RNA polymerase II subunit RPB7 [Tetrabaena socialis]